MQLGNLGFTKRGRSHPLSNLTFKLLVLLCIRWYFYQYQTPPRSLYQYQYQYGELLVLMLGVVKLETWTFYVRELPDIWTFGLHNHNAQCTSIMHKLTDIRIQLETLAFESFWTIRGVTSKSRIHPQNIFLDNFHACLGHFRLQYHIRPLPYHRWPPWKYFWSVCTNYIKVTK